MSHPEANCCRIVLVDRPQLRLQPSLLACIVTTWMISSNCFSLATLYAAAHIFLSTLDLRVCPQFSPWLLLSCLLLFHKPC
jgi:hypothetical protein